MRGPKHKKSSIHVVGQRNDAESAWNKTTKQLAGKEIAKFHDSTWIIAAMHYWVNGLNRVATNFILRILSF